MENNLYQSLKTVYKESSEAFKNQQAGIDLMFNKLNWILVSNAVVLAALWNNKNPNAFVLLLLIVSSILSLIALDPIDFKVTAKLSEQLEKIKDDNYLKKLIKIKIQAYNANIKKSKKLAWYLYISKWLLIFALSLQFILYVVPLLKMFYL